MSYLDTFLLGVLQGVTEFLPVSSSGHLVLLERSFNIEPNLTLNVFLHLGTLAAIIFYYLKDVGDIFVILFKGFTRKIEFSSPDFQFVLKLGAATLVTAVLGFALRNPVEHIFTLSIAPKLLGAMFLLTATSLIVLHILKGKDSRHLEITFKGALLIGFVQGIAVIPGISRSGSTIVAALLLGMAGKEAARFSFLLAIPVIAGAGLLEARHLSSLSHLGPVFVGVLAALVAGFLSLVFLVKLVNKGKISYFAYYLIPLSFYTFFFAK